MNQLIENNKLLLMISENQLTSIIENAVKKAMVELSIKDDAPPDEWLTSPELGKWLKISPSTIVNWRRNGKIKAHKINGRVLFKRTQVLKKINELRTQHREVH